MSNPDLESRVLALARARGLLAEGSEGLRLHDLVAKGLLMPEQLEALAGELLREPSGGGALDTACPDSWVDRKRSEVPLVLEIPRFGHYRDLTLLGRGSQGRVYRAFDERLERWVALKLLHPGSSRSHLDEARAQAQVDHPHVCKVFEVGETEGQPFIALQLVSGRTLARADLGREALVGVMRDVAEGVHAAHRLGLLHLDLKPGNILLETRAQGRPHAYVTDFGIGTWEGESARSSFVLGTPPFCSPEQASSEGPAPDPRSDVYGLGATLYTLLARTPPFADSSADSFGLLLERIHREEPEPLRALAPEVPRDLERIVRKAMAKRREERYASALALAEDLQRFLDGAPVHAGDRSVGTRLAKWVRRNRLASGLAAAALLLVLGGGAFLAYTLGRERRREALIQRFDRSVMDAGYRLRLTEMTPIHDRSPELQALRDRMAEVEADMRRLGPAAQGPGHEALGLGCMELDDYRQARRELEAAWAAGSRSPETAEALGFSMFVLHSYRLTDGPLPKDPVQAQAQLDRELKAPALAYLKTFAGRGMTPLSQAVVDEWEGRSDDAIRRCEAILRADPSNGRSLIFLFRMRDQLNPHTMSLEEYRRKMQEAQDALDQCLRVHPSNPVYWCVASEWYSRVAWVYRGDPKATWAAYLRAEQAADNAATIDPKLPDALWIKASQLSTLATMSAELGQPTSDYPERALAAVQAAAAVAPNGTLVPINTTQTYVRIYRALATRKMLAGDDPFPDYARALEWQDRILQKDSSGYQRFVKVDLLVEKAEAELVRGLDPDFARTRTDIDTLLDRLTQDFPKTLGVVHAYRGHIGALEACRRALQGRPDPALQARSAAELDQYSGTYGLEAMVNIARLLLDVGAMRGGDAAARKDFRARLKRAQADSPTDALLDFLAKRVG